MQGIKATIACQKIENMCFLAASELGMEQPFHSLAVGMSKGKGKSVPKMRLKATQARRFLILLRFMLLRFFPRESSYSLIRYSCVDFISRLYEEMGAWKSDGSSARAIAEYDRRHLLLCFSRTLRAEPEGLLPPPQAPSLLSLH